MSLETPRFMTALEEEGVVVTAEEHTALESAVLFEMLGATIIRTYNINTPKNENIWLELLPDRADARAAVTELDPSETLFRVTGFITDFTALSEKLKSVSERQFRALVEHAEARLATPIWEEF